MASRTIDVHGIVIGKTKLGEADLIIRMLAEDGSRVEAIAKGARKPQGSLSAKVELFNEIEGLLSEGRGLGILKECRLVKGAPTESRDPAIMAAAASMAEFAAKTSQVELAVPRFFDLLRTGLDSLEGVSAPTAAALTAALVLKGASILGTRPQLRGCAVCGQEAVAKQGRMLVSLADGGVVCSDCAAVGEARAIPESIILWADHLIKTPFGAIAAETIDSALAFELLGFASEWSAFQLGASMRSVASLEAFAALSQVPE